MNKKTCVLSLSHDEAERFFLKSESYFNASLPSYIKFNNLLGKIKEGIDKNLTLELFYAQITKAKGNSKDDSPKNYENVNHIIYSNKDGKHAWRPLQLINPAIYVQLVMEITTKRNWEEIQNRFNGIENFWNQAKLHLRKFNGVPKEHFWLFLKECEWRFNYSNPKTQLRQLKQWVQGTLT